MSFSVETDQTYCKNLQSSVEFLFIYLFISLVFFDVHRTKTLFHFHRKIQLMICLKRNNKTHQAAILTGINLTAFV